MDQSVTLAKMIDSWNSYIVDWALLLAAVAAITMALLELAKAILRLRPKYHRWRLRSWLREGGTIKELFILAVGDAGTPNALLDQPTDKMMGQIQAAAQTALDFPLSFPALYTFMTREPSAEGAAPAEEVDAEIWRRFCARVEEGGKLDSESTEVTRATRARARLDHFTARKLDAFQTVTEYIWSRFNQVVAVVGATAFLIFLFTSQGKLSATTVATAFFGGMLSPLAKDLVTALSGIAARRT